MNVALIGFGYWGPNIARNLHASDKTTLYAICDVSEAMLDKARSLYGSKVQYHRDYRQLLQDPSVDAVALALRYDVSYPIACDALNAKKHLFIEKPLAVTSRQAAFLGQLSRQNGVVLHTDHILIYHPIIRYIKKMIDSGELGELLYFDSSRGNLGPHIKNDINAMWDLAVHDLAVLDFFCGGKTPVEVKAVGMRHYGMREELTYLSLKYSDLVAFLKSSWISPLKERLMIVGGTKKMVVFDDLKIDEKLMVYDKGVMRPEEFTEYGRYEAKIRLGDMFAPYIPVGDSLRNSLEHFAGCVEHQRESDSGYPQAERVISILEQADAQLGGREAHV